MWNIQAKLIPIVVGALGTVPRRLPEYLRNDWCRYVGGDDPEDCSFEIIKDLERGHGTVKISTGLP